MPKKKATKKKDSFWKIGTKSTAKTSKDFMKTVNSGKGNLGKNFFKI